MTQPAKAPLAAQPDQMERAFGYLTSVYDPVVGLVSETPFGDDQGRKLYWMNDNIFAIAAFREHGTDSDKILAEDIQRRIVTLAELLNLPRYEDGFPKLGLHEVVLGYPLNVPLPCSNTYILFEDGYKLGLTIWNGTRDRECFVQDFNGYADNLLYESLAAFYDGNLTYARSRFRDAVRLWDGTGLADNSFTNPGDPQYQRYATYKLALLLYVAEKLQEALPFWNQAVETIWRMQAYNGGIITNYGKQTTPIGGANTETTAIALLANPTIRETTTTDRTQTKSPSEPPYMQAIVVLVLIALVLDVLILAYLFRRRTGPLANPRRPCQACLSASRRVGFPSWAQRSVSGFPDSTACICKCASSCIS
jgi:hypothetical protein